MCWHPKTELTENIKILLCKIIQQMLLEDKECKTTLSQSMKECKDHPNYLGVFQDIDIHEQYSVYLSLFKQILFHTSCDGPKKASSEYDLLHGSAFLSLFFYLEEKYFKADAAISDSEITYKADLLLYKRFVDTYGICINKEITTNASWAKKLEFITDKYSWHYRKHNRVNSVADNGFIVQSFEDVYPQLEALIDCYLEK